MLGQSELTILVEPRLPSKIFQGITTEITGEGGSIAPLSDAIVAEDKLGYEHTGIKPDWRTLGDYFQRLEKQGMGINLASFVGATQVRRMVIGQENRAADAGRAGAHERAGPRGHGAGGGRRLDLAPVRAGALRLHRGADRAGRRELAPRRHLRHPHAQRERGRDGGDRRGDPHRPRGAYAGRDLAPEGGRQAELGAHARSRRQDRGGAARTAWTSPPTPTPTRPGSTPSRPSSRPGPTRAATTRCSRG